MRWIIFSLLLSTITLVAGSCKNHKHGVQELKLQDKLSLQHGCTIAFRKSYYLPDNASKAEEKNMLDELPGLSEIDYYLDRPILQKLQNYGFVKDKFLLLDRFISDTAKQGTISNASNETVQFKFYEPGEDGINFHTFVINSKFDTISHTFAGFDHDIKYRILDIIPGDYPEIVVLDKWYIMNGHNYDFLIFQVTGR